MHRLKEKLFSIYITVNKFQPPTESVSDSTHILPPVSSSCHSGPTKKTHGTVNHRLGAADRMCEDMMGSGETCAGTESLIHLVDDRSVSPWKLTIDGT